LACIAMSENPVRRKLISIDILFMS
jgi:hypothetical protein